MNISFALAAPDNNGEDELAGIKLGFSAEHVKKILGPPQNVSEKTSEDNKTKELIWEYPGKGIKILFRDEKVDVIMIQEPCTTGTPRGLKIGDSWRKALQVYNYCSAYVQDLGFQIGIVFTLPDGIKFSIAVPSNKEEITNMSLWREEK